MARCQHGPTIFAKKSASKSFKMQLKTFVLPVVEDGTHTDALNRFLRSVKVLEIKKDFVKVDDGAYWAICVTYIPSSNYDSKYSFSKEKVDYKEVLSESQFERFSVLRKIRKQLADEDAVPAFAVFTDAELSEISKMPILNLDGIKHIKGIGIKKVEKYGVELCKRLERCDDEA